MNIMKAKKPPYTISLYRTTNGIFPIMRFNYSSPKGATIRLDIWKPYKTDAGAERGILRLARKMGLVK